MKKIPPHLLGEGRLRLERGAVQAREL